jgi:hypothetical protein
MLPTRPRRKQAVRCALRHGIQDVCSRELLERAWERTRAIDLDE